MGRDIYAYIERKSKNGEWECVATDEEVLNSFHLYRDSELFSFLSYNAYCGEECIPLRPLKEWVTTVSTETARYLFFRITGSVFDRPILFPDDKSLQDKFKKMLDPDCDETVDAAMSWVDKKVSFLLTEKIVSNPDACYWNWCTADELRWAVFKYQKGYSNPTEEKDEYLKLASFMKNIEKEGYEVRMVYSYDFSTRWL